MSKIINIAVIAHVDAGKSTLVDAFLDQSGIFRENEEKVDCIMDSDAIERERGITIYSKNCSIKYEDYKINIVDTPGHADFSSEVERIIKTVDTVILLVDSSEGPMPQTRFVLKKSLEQGLNPILLINKIDKKDARIDEVIEMTYELFMDLEANDEQLDFPILYGIAKKGMVTENLGEDSGSIKPLLETIVKHCDPYPDRNGEHLQLQISALDYDAYLGRLGVGRITKGVLKENQQVVVYNRQEELVTKKIASVFTYEGLGRAKVKEAGSGEIVVVSGIDDISIGETICDPEDPMPLEMIKIDDPTIAMNFMVNSSPFAGEEGKYLTSRHIRERLEKELEVNVGLLIEDTESMDTIKVSGRGELHLSILIENMRREGYELAVSRPEVIMKKDASGATLEPVEEVVINTPEVYSGTIISKLNKRKGVLKNMHTKNDFTTLEFVAPTRGLLGYRQEFINDTRGEGTMVRRVYEFQPYKGEIVERVNGVAIAQSNGTATGYALNNIAERVELFIKPGDRVYEGMIVGKNSRSQDMEVNPSKSKKATNMRASGSDDAVKLPPHTEFTLEEALEFIANDELVEVTPSSIRLRKKYLKELERRRNHA